jgi:hypothetical protein
MPSLPYARGPMTARPLSLQTHGRTLTHKRILASRFVMLIVGMSIAHVLVRLLPGSVWQNVRTRVGCVGACVALRRLV